eukprot:2510343-Lingulodinium_polyedra.AAC.1
MSEPRWGRHPIMVVKAAWAAACAHEMRTTRRKALAQWLSRPISRKAPAAGACLGLGKWAQTAACHNRGGV